MYITGHFAASLNGTDMGDTEQGWEVVEGGPKTEGSGREVSLVEQDVATLKAWKRKQAALRASLAARA